MLLKGKNKKGEQMSIIKGFIVSLIAVGGFQHSKELCEGFVEENDMYITADAKGLVGGINEEDFNDVIDQASAIYAPIFTEQGVNLIVERKWSDGTVNAYARQSGKNWIVSMFGGLARHETTTKDAFMLVICHEIGHHIGGAPKYTDWYGNPDWASNEGQSDYFAGLKCARKVFSQENNVALMANQEVPEMVKAHCANEHVAAEAQAICARIAMAGQQVGYLFQDLRKESTVPAFETPDTKEVSKTSHRHPGTQCRLDTYFNSGVCGMDFNVDVDQADYKTGACIATTHELGNRPRCWFKPE